MSSQYPNKNISYSKVAGNAGNAGNNCQIKSELSHDQLQQKCFMWAWGHFPALRKLFWHTPNELPRKKGESTPAFLKRLNQRKAIGVVKGILDLVFYYRGALHVFDFKVGNDRLSEDQEEFINQVVSHGGFAYEIRSFEQFQTVFMKIIKP